MAASGVAVYTANRSLPTLFPLSLFLRRGCVQGRDEGIINKFDIFASSLSPRKHSMIDRNLGPRGRATHPPRRTCVKIGTRDLPGRRESLRYLRYACGRLNDRLRNILRTVQLPLA